MRKIIKKEFRFVIITILISLGTLLITLSFQKMLEKWLAGEFWKVLWISMTLGVLILALAAYIFKLRKDR